MTLHEVPSTPSTRLDALEEARRLKVVEARMGFLLREVAELRTIADGLMRHTQATKGPPQLTVVQGGEHYSRSFTANTSSLGPEKRKAVVVLVPTTLPASRTAERPVHPRQDLPDGR